MEDKRILVIDDDPGKMSSAAQLFGNAGRGILIDGFLEIEEDLKKRYGFYLESGREEEIKKALSEKYRAILLDGNLEMLLEEEYFDGAVVARKLREGCYGSVNIDTPIVSTSSQHDAIPLAEFNFCLPVDPNKAKGYLKYAEKLLEKYK